MQLLSRTFWIAAITLSLPPAAFPSPALRLHPVSHSLTAISARQQRLKRSHKCAVNTFGSIDHVVNNAGIFLAKPFTDYTDDDFRRLVSTNLEGFILITQRAVRQMLLQGGGGSVTTITAALADNPMAGSPASIAMLTKGGLNAITVSLASEYAKSNIRFNAVAPGVVDTPLHQDSSKESLNDLTPMGIVADAKAIAEAVIYLIEARYVTGEVLHVDGGAHVGRW